MRSANNEPTPHTWGVLCCTEIYLVIIDLAIPPRPGRVTRMIYGPLDSETMLILLAMHLGLTVAEYDVYRMEHKKAATTNWSSWQRVYIKILTSGILSVHLTYWIYFTKGIINVKIQGVKPEQATTVCYPANGPHVTGEIRPPVSLPQLGFHSDCKCKWVYRVAMYTSPSAVA